MHQNYIKYNAKTTPKYPQSFTGKERDSETGFSYFGARYYDSDLMTGWLSVDPLADKYPGLSPYAYCAWNPIKLVDPDGEDIWLPEILEDGSINYIKEEGDNAETLYNGTLDPNVNVTVENNTGAVLPETGGAGTTILYAVGGLLTVLAVVLLVTKKRVNG